MKAINVLRLLLIFPLLLTACGQFGSETPAPTALSLTLEPVLAPTGADVPNTGAEPSAPTPTGDTPATSEDGTASAVEVCRPPASLTPEMTEGPYYKSGTPERASLVEPGMPGSRLTISGYVLDQDCRPIPNAWLDFWQTDADGNYDNTGFGMRGHQYTDQNGRYRLETVVPGLYPGRTAHIHVKVQAPGGPVLTSQLFIPNEPDNQTDRIFSDALLIRLEQVEGGWLGEFNFVVETG